MARSGVTPAVRLQSVSLQLGAVWALRDVNLQIEPGERVALVGANGSGKSSLLRVMHGLRRPTSGLCEQASDLRQSMLFQRPHMLRLSVRHNVALGLWLAGVRWPQALSQAQAALERAGLGDLVSRRATALSGGQMQRVALARAWALQPQVLLLDEPTSSLDPHAKREVERLVGELTDCAGTQGMTLVFASHNLGQVKRLARRVIYLEGGRVKADLPVQDFFNDALLEARFPEAQAFVRGETA